MLFTMLNSKFLPQNISDYIKGIFQESNIYYLSQSPAKNLLRVLSNFSISRNPSLPKGIFRCNDKRCKICRLYIIECSEFELTNRKRWKIKRNITWHSRNNIYSLKCKLRMYETYIGKTIGDHIMVLKEEWITILLKVEVGYQRANSPFMPLIASK